MPVSGLDAHGDLRGGSRVNLESEEGVRVGRVSHREHLVPVNHAVPAQRPQRVGGIEEDDRAGLAGESPGRWWNRLSG